MYGPYEFRSDAREELVEQLGESFTYDDTLRALRESLVRCEVKLGSYDEQALEWVVRLGHPLPVQALRAMILRAYDAGCARGEASVNYRNASSTTPGIYDLSEEPGVPEG
jgi:hypothetical protein